MKNFDKNVQSSYLVYLDANNLYGWVMSQKLPVNDFEWIEMNDLSNVIHIRFLKQALNHGLVLKKVHSVIKFYQEAWRKSYIDMNTTLRTDAKKDFFKLVNNSVFGKTMENVRNHKDIKIVTTNKQQNTRLNRIIIQLNKFRKIY